MVKQNLKDTLSSLRTFKFQHSLARSSVSGNANSNLPYLDCRIQYSTITGLDRGTLAYKTMLSGLKIEPACTTFHTKGVITTTET